MTNHKSGFGLLELLIAITIIALLSTMVVPALWRRLPNYERNQFIDRLNALSLLAWQQALSTSRIHQVLFNFKTHQISVKISSDKQDIQGGAEFEAIRNVPVGTTAPIPESIVVKNFIIDGKDLMKLFTNRPSEEVWFLVYPDGVGQEVIINCVDTKQKRGKNPVQLGLVLNPFSVQFDAYDEFQK